MWSIRKVSILYAEQAEMHGYNAFLETIDTLVVKLWPAN